MNLAQISTTSKAHLTVRFLISGTSTRTAELLGLRVSRVSNQQGSVVAQISLLELVLRLLVNKLLVKGNQTLGNGLSDSIELRNVSTSADSDSNVNVGKLVETNNEERLVDLESEGLGLDKADGRAVKFEETFAGLDVGDSGSSLLLAESLRKI